MTIEFKFIRQILAFAFAAALVYCIAVFSYIRHMAYEEIFILYVGNFLFAAVIGIFVAWFYKRHERNIGTIRLVVIGGKTAVAGIVIACLLVLLMLVVMVPEIFNAASADVLSLQGSPGQFAGKNKGFGKILFLNAILGNAGASFFISLLIPFSVMKNIYPGEEKSSHKSKQEENPKTNYKL
ncbi:MAG: hypothetical protein ABIU63_14295 [Chitinophagaceae bacterium]